ncbi:hypothetical protein Pla123a_41920 [Posidoniimonas polymericola]|uniref:Uncharacterized protein n=1 Tax=Posidoniimonas polymericola TaxID=2528002 RepID=A0A5C5XWD2_9BACT|nr:hypothetical protein [Posidoniimonas polymericola]TWT67636.1 hypothetical protein Pla123a_41920 [Posidoniimonas polymericola]
MLSPSEQKTLATFRQFLMTPNKMLCFWGPALERHRDGLSKLEDKELVVPEGRAGGYSLTRSGFEAMRADGRRHATPAVR